MRHFIFLIDEGLIDDGNILRLKILLKIKLDKK
jgi:hypothetical protein